MSHVKRLKQNYMEKIQPTGLFSHLLMTGYSTPNTLKLDNVKK